MIVGDAITTTRVGCLKRQLQYAELCEMCLHQECIVYIILPW